MTYYKARTRGDAIRFITTGNILDGLPESPILAAVGATPGMFVAASGGLNGPGAGEVQQTADGRLQWKAPGSATFGEPIDVSSGGGFVLEDGEDLDKWARVSVFVAFQLGGAAGAIVHLQDLYNQIGQADVDEAGAAAGEVVTWNVDLRNLSGARVDGVVAWLDAAASAGLEISDDNATWVAPTTEGAALALGDLEPSATVSLFFRRTIAPAAPPDPAVLIQALLAWTGI